MPSGLSMGRLVSIIYSCVHLAAMPWIAYRVIKAGRFRDLLPRFGVGLDVRSQRSVWLHGSSVGEVTLIEPLVKQLERDYPQYKLVITAYTQTGLAAAKLKFPRHLVWPFPFDFRFVIRRFMRQLQPELCVIVESEFWPNFISVLADAEVPIAVLNGKMSLQSYQFHRRTAFVAHALRKVDVIAVQDDSHAERLAALGIAKRRIHVTGNMKYDLVTLSDGRAMRVSLGINPGEIVIIGGSLHAGEDDAVIDAFQHCRHDVAGLQLILVPRYPSDAQAIERKLRKLGMSLVRKSQLDAASAGPAQRASVIVVDTLGELRSLYAAADIAFVGGSLFYRGHNKGGHNLMEPAACGVPVIFGSHNYSFKDVAKRLVAANGGIEVADAESLCSAISGLLGDPGRRRDMGMHARQTVESGRGATARNMLLLKTLLEPGQY